MVDRHSGELAGSSLLGRPGARAPLEESARDALLDPFASWERRFALERFVVGGLYADSAR